MPRFFVGLAAVLLLSAAHVVAQSDIFLVSLSFPSEIAEWQEKEYVRVAKLCGENPSECWSRELQRKTWVLNPVYAAPDDNAQQTGRVVVVSSGDPGGWLQLRFEYRPESGPQVVWLNPEEIGDWGYGIRVVVHAKGEPSQGDTPVWIQLSGAGGPRWLKLQHGIGSQGVSVGLTGELEPIVEHVFEVDPGIRATNRRTGRRVRLPSQLNYVPERVRGNEVFLRQEVGADMPCGGDKEEQDRPTPATSRYRVAVEELFGSDGKPRMRLAYPKGCPP